AWMAVKGATLDDLVAHMKLKNSRSVSWEEGITFAYDNKVKVVFLTPPIKGWILVVGWPAAAVADAEPVKSFYKTTEALSARFGEVQAFATHRVLEYHLWMLAKDGDVVRSFAYAGETGEFLDNMGPLTEAERNLSFSNQPPERWTPNEDDV